MWDRWCRILKPLRIQSDPVGTPLHPKALLHPLPPIPPHPAPPHPPQDEWFLERMARKKKGELKEEEERSFAKVGGWNMSPKAHRKKYGWFGRSSSGVEERGMDPNLSREEELL